MTKGDFAVVDNSGFLATGIKNETKALKVIKDLKSDSNFVPSGNLTVVRVFGTYDKFISGDVEYLGADGKPKTDK